MALSQWLGLGGAVLLLSFIAFAFRKGTKVKPSGNDPDAWRQYGGPDLPPGPHN